MEKNQYFGFVGTYTKGASEGIYTFRLDTAAKKLTNVKVAAKLDNPTYLALSTDQQYLYAVAKVEDQGGLAAFSVSAGVGSGLELTEMNRQLSVGSPPCHVSVDLENRAVLSANYHKGTIEAYTVHQDSGALEANPAMVRHEGSGPDKRQDKAHAHYAGFTPDQKYVIAIDLGIDRVFTYTLSSETGEFTEVAALSVNPGSGPRHLVFHPNGSIAYLLTEFSSEVLVLQYHPEEGRFTQLQAVSAIPDGFTENNQGSAIHISSDGRFLYAGNRGHNSIAVFRINQDTKLVELIEHTSSEGNWPRDFSLDPSENFLVASNQESSSLVLFARDTATGRLSLLQSDIPVPDPVCVKFFAKN